MEPKLFEVGAKVRVKKSTVYVDVYNTDKEGEIVQAAVVFSDPELPVPVRVKIGHFTYWFSTEELELI
jgi:hypothetical protein